MARAATIGEGRHGFRRHALDGAALFFQPATGVHVRVATAATAALRRTAPRVAMFGITNACNLTCDFCSRDVARPSAWTVATAAATLRGLHDAGTLEVAYGGGEPFAFRGFAELIAELDTTTTLAQHVTTNGTLLRADTWPRFAGRFGQVRMSIYDGVPWRGPAALLAGHGQRWGANALIEPAALAGLPTLLAELAGHGCHDVSLLAYVGPDRTRQLDRADEARLAAIIADSPLPCRLSVCFGDRIAVPRLPTGDARAAPDDCGAGRDFVSITPDRRVQSCSFQDRGLPGATADEILAAWRDQQPTLAAPSPRRGCARLQPLGPARPAPPPIAVWQAFSGNNSGECVMVATFAAADDAAAFLAELTPGWTPDGDYSPAWRQLFIDEGVVTATFASRTLEVTGDDSSPRELVAIGRAVIAAQTAPDDAFPELRALAWKRGAHVVPGGVHVHDSLGLVFAIAATGGADADALVARALPAARVHRHGELVIGTVPILDPRGPGLPTLVAARDALAALAGDRPYAAEVLFDLATDDDLTAARQRLGHRRPTHPRLWTAWWGESAAAQVAACARVLPLDRTTIAGTSALVDPAPDRKRLAILAYRHGANVSALDGPQIRLTATVWYEPPPAPPRGAPRPPPRVVDGDHVEAILRATLPPASTLTVVWPEHRTYRPSPVVTIDTDAPAPALQALAAYAATVDARLTVWAAELDRLTQALGRVVDAVGG